MTDPCPRYSLRVDEDHLETGLLAELEAHRVFAAQPRRSFRWHLGQRHYPGRYWSATTGSFVGYESRLELAVLLLEDFHPHVTRIASQPFEMIADRDGSDRSHIPDYLVSYADSSYEVIDVKPARRLENAEVADALGWAGEIIESRGWRFRIAKEPQAALLSNVRFLAGYRRASQFVTDDVSSVEESVRDAATVGEAMRLGTAAVGDAAAARTIVLHLLWGSTLRCDLTKPLDVDTILELM